MATPAVLAVLALVLAGPASYALGLLPVLRRTPRAAMVLWQAVALAAVLAALGAGLSLGTERGMGAHGAGSYAVALVALLATVTVLARLLLSGHLVGTRLRRLRRRHRDLLDLLADVDSRSEELRVLHAGAPMAYCVPAVTGSRVVVSEATLGRLGAVELDAVMAHERAHLRARHDLVLEAFTVLHEAFPAVVTSRRALAEVRLLVEVLADRAARHRVGTRPLVRALSELAGASPPEAALGATHGIGERLAVLLDERPHRLQAGLVFALAAAVLLVPTALVVAPWLAQVM
ncbi:M56 family peptidase [Nocardioides mangrovicus]|uniref:M56 family peptidase n=1 Tax=Nocardioides mangrovicus TaxID=2478913 RepID=A0A3L8P394_9ACTN|nr:M56 family metallopeptidase [Nocardioides mangrovicus]RLV48918.1 M56 family peptidase [Nocardioides mangrovicus]